LIYLAVQDSLTHVCYLVVGENFLAVQMKKFKTSSLLGAAVAVVVGFSLQMAHAETEGEQKDDSVVSVVRVDTSVYSKDDKAGAANQSSGTAAGRRTVVSGVNAIAGCGSGLIFKFGAYICKDILPANLGGIAPASTDVQKIVSTLVPVIVPQLLPPSFPSGGGSNSAGGQQQGGYMGADGQMHLGPSDASPTCDCTRQIGTTEEHDTNLGINAAAVENAAALADAAARAEAAQAIAQAQAAAEASVTAETTASVTAETTASVTAETTAAVTAETTAAVTAETTAAVTATVTSEVSTAVTQSSESSSESSSSTTSSSSESSSSSTSTTSSSESSSSSSSSSGD
jgi:hypothetical protein